MVGRLGVALDYRTAWLGPGGPTRTFVYGIANLYREFLDGTTLELGGVPLHMENEKLWGGLGVLPLRMVPRCEGYGCLQ